MNPYPEHDKLLTVKARSQSISDFLDWMLDKYGAEFYSCWPEYRAHYQVFEGQAVPGPVQIDRKELLARFFGLDLRRLAEEKEQMIEDMRAANT